MPDAESAALATRRRRLLYRATHRGTFENDLMIGGFVRANLDSLTETDLAAVEALLDIPDVDLAEWLTGRRPIPDEAATPMLLRIRAAVEASGANPLPRPAGTVRDD